MNLNTIEEGISSFKNGKPVIIVDDENRENEGDLTIPAESITPEIINFMATNARGLICVAIEKEYLENLNIPLIQKILLLFLLKFLILKFFQSITKKF